MTITVSIPQVLGKLDKNVFFIENGKQNTLTDAEVTDVITDGILKAAGFLGLTNPEEIEDNPIIKNAVATWSAGLLWNQKLGAKGVPNTIEGSGGKTFGDKLIISAKEDLKVFKPKNATASGIKIGFHTVSGGRKRN